MQVFLFIVFLLLAFFLINCVIWAFEKKNAIEIDPKEPFLHDDIDMMDDDYVLIEKVE